MKTTITLLTLLLIAFTTNAQQYVALQSNGSTSVFAGLHPFQQAYDSAVAGDTIYLPGGTLTSLDTLDKKLAIYGAGHFPDTSKATNKTVLIGILTFGENADGSHLEGVEIQANIEFVPNAKVDNLSITRCKFDAIRYLGTSGNYSTYNSITECVIDYYLTLQNLSLSIISNNIIKDRFHYGVSNTISNNILLHNDYYDHTFNYVTSSTITNNILYFTNKKLQYACIANTFQKNVWNGSISEPNNYYLNNTSVNIPSVQIFENQSGFYFNYEHDYHLDSSYNFLGTDSLPVGIYGGIAPFKEASVPSIPHIYYKDIDPNSDSNGNLNIHLKVNAETD